MLQAFLYTTINGLPLYARTDKDVRELQEAKYPMHDSSRANSFTTSPLHPLIYLTSFLRLLIISASTAYLFSLLLFLFFHISFPNPFLFFLLMQQIAPEIYHVRPVWWSLSISSAGNFIYSGSLNEFIQL